MKTLTCLVLGVAAMYASGVPKSSILPIRNSTLSMPGIPLSVVISLKQPRIVPSAEAPLSPTI